MKLQPYDLNSRQHSVCRRLGLSQTRRSYCPGVRPKTLPAEQARSKSCTKGDKRVGKAARFVWLAGKREGLEKEKIEAKSQVDYQNKNKSSINHRS